MIEKMSFQNRFARTTTFLACVLVLCAFSMEVRADGTEMLGDPVDFTVASGSEVFIAGVGLYDAQPGTISVAIPGGVTINQVILYWEGAETTEAGQGDTDTITANLTAVTGDRIGGPTERPLGNWASTYREDITALGFVQAGMTNDISIDGLDFDYANDGAGVVVIVDDGVTPADVQLKDGNDCAYHPNPSPLETTVPVTFSFAPSDVVRTGQLDMFFASVGVGRPSLITIDIDGVPADEVVDGLFDSDGPEWDSLTHGVTIPAFATSLTVQVLSEDAGTGPFAGANPASIVWITCCFSLAEPPTCTGRIGDFIWEDTNRDGIQDMDEFGIAGVRLLLYSDCGPDKVFLAETFTDADGFYEFDGLCAGDYQIEIDETTVPAGLTETLPNQGGDDELDSDFVNGMVCMNLPTDDAVDLSIDGGFQPPGELVGAGTPGYWKNHPEAWPVDEITVGGQTFSRDDAIAQILCGRGGDKTITLAQQLIATKLNLLIGTEPSCIAATVVEADAFLVMHPVGSGLSGDDEAWTLVGEPIKDMLDKYNNGELCAPSRDDLE
jgi:hypothetical protein